MFGWSYESFPELAHLPPNERDEVWKRCEARANRQIGVRIAWTMVCAGAASPGLLVRFLGPQLVAIPFGIVIPFVTVAVAVHLPQFYIYSARRRLIPMELAGSCSECGYLLTGNVSGHCPEC